MIRTDYTRRGTYGKVLLNFTGAPPRSSNHPAPPAPPSPRPFPVVR